MQLQSDYSLELCQELTEQLSQVSTTEGQDPCLRHDTDLKQYEKHLRARRDMYIGSSCIEADPERLNNLLAISHNILQEKHDWKALQTCIDDVADWLIQLNALEQSLELQGLNYERISTIQLLVRLYEMADPVRATEFITKLTALGVQYARLGYSGNAGLVFRRAYRYMSTTAVPAPYITDLHLAYAEYFLGIGNYEKSENYLNIAQDQFLHDDHKTLGKHQTIQVTSNAASVYAQLSAAKGDFSRALFFTDAGEFDGWIQSKAFKHSGSGNEYQNPYWSTAPIKSRTMFKSKAAMNKRAKDPWAPAAEPRSTELAALQCTRARLIRHQASIALLEGDFDRVEFLLQKAMQPFATALDHIMHTSLTAKVTLGRALASMTSDLVFCVIPESTICCPAIRANTHCQDNSSVEEIEELLDQSVPTRSRTGRLNNKSTKVLRMTAIPGFVELLSQCQDDLSKIRSLVVSAGSTVDLHTFVDMSMRTAMMLSAFPLSGAQNVQSPLLAMYVIEIGRTSATNKQHQALCIERQLSLTRNPENWPANDVVLTQPHETIPSDLASFQSQYLDIIPSSWTVFSLTLSESQDEIRITKFRPHHGPFILNLPLGRRSQDGDEEPFGFEQGKTELRDIVTLANFSTHDAPDPSRKGARTAWWEARAALDARLKDLLVNIESIWFGGFRGVFGHNVGSLDLLSRFQQSLNNILDKHLPSRQKPTKAKESDQIALDLHVLELFVTLGNPNEREIDEELLDLLYFVIDILQFHGERNAYDEVDFDAMTIELLDALRQYHETAKTQESASSSQHTILILDKALHCFPWESLPCLKGQAVSRLPSLGSLRDRILQQTKQQQVKVDTSTDPMLTISRSGGAYILNPGGDLIATQSRFEEPLEKLANWNAITNREPSEADIKMALESRDIFLYFGHGSGSQYIRSRTIQKLEKCAVALLMGCSSGALTEAGEFESYGTPINYMQAGCPAVLATLWDVTDKDIDRFSQTVLEKWGLFEQPQPDVSSSPVKKGGRSRDKGKGRKARNMDVDRRSLDQAVAEGRDSCIMKYLNGAAPIIYGVPVRLS
ncbi:hypothetical protein G7Y79_00001g001560 [Physcia stellaris]|nr:hypothetical protein G7Y79_00001g001560 [Physcia stellaris]